MIQSFVGTGVSDLPAGSARLPVDNFCFHALTAIVALEHVGFTETRRVLSDTIRSCQPMRRLEKSVALDGWVKVTGPDRHRVPGWRHPASVVMVGHSGHRAYRPDLDPLMDGYAEKRDRLPQAVHYAMYGPTYTLEQAKIAAFAASLWITRNPAHWPRRGDVWEHDGTLTVLRVPYDEEEWVADRYYTLGGVALPDSAYTGPGLYGTPLSGRGIWAVGRRFVGNLFVDDSAEIVGVERSDFEIRQAAICSPSGKRLVTRDAT